jgi:serine/threonine protein kinase
MIARSRNDPPTDWPTKKTIIAFGIAFAMEYMHGRGFAHRDLKPANIFLNAMLEPVIGDLGLATNFQTGEHADDANDGPSMALGTPLHMAPELWVDESSGYSHKVDVYAYAVLLYSLFVNDPEAMLDDGKGRAGNPRVLLNRTKNGVRFKRVNEINDAYWDLISKCWNQSPAARPAFDQIVDEMITNITAFLMPEADEAAVQRYVETMKARR